MCYLIYLSLIALFAIYSDAILQQFSLITAADDGQWITVATGWEMLMFIWPVILMAIVLSSAVTFFVSRRLQNKSM